MSQNLVYWTFAKSKKNNQKSLHVHVSLPDTNSQPNCFLIKFCLIVNFYFIYNQLFSLEPTGTERHLKDKAILCCVVREKIVQKCVQMFDLILTWNIGKSTLS